MGRYTFNPIKVGRSTLIWATPLASNLGRRKDLEEESFGLLALALALTVKFTPSLALDDISGIPGYTEDQMRHPALWTGFLDLQLLDSH